MFAAILIIYREGDNDSARENKIFSFCVKLLLIMYNKKECRGARFGC